MKKSLIDLPVLMIFFTRPNTLEKVFEKVKEARPSKLFLACDGAREGNLRDIDAIEKCKKIVENIDWECEVHKHYSEVNLGCGKGPQTAISWAFEYTDRLVILEDDCVPDITFFPYMAELLEKYKDDERIGMISGLNHLKEWDCGGNSYCFTKTGATCGWGTWKRVWKDYDYYLSDINDKYIQNLLLNDIRPKKIAKIRISEWERANRETTTKSVRYWDFQFGFLKYSHSYLAIVPKHNLICNIGVGIGSTHTENNKKEQWKKGKILFMPTAMMDIPLVHPKYIACDRNYDYARNKIIYKSKFQRAFNKIKRIFK